MGKDGMLHPARLTTVYLMVPILLLLVMPAPGSSCDAQGKYVTLGMGLESCQTFLAQSALRADS
jgi:hypothetical protein